MGDNKKDKRLRLSTGKTLIKSKMNWWEPVIWEL